MDVFQDIAGLIATGKVFASVTGPARTLDQISDFKIKPVVRPSGNESRCGISALSFAVVTGIVT